MRSLMRAAVLLLAPGMIVALCSVPSARAADTTETWDAGAADVELYFRFDGLLLPAPAQTFGADIVVGYGIVDRFSAYLAAALQADGWLNSAGQGFRVGLFGTPLETEHVDIDLLVEVASDSSGAFALSPGLELNLDVAEDRSVAGAYLRAGSPVAGGADGNAARVSLEVVAGAYAAVHERHQLLLELDAVARFDRDGGGPRLELGALAFGYNVAVHHSVELVTQLSIDLAQGDEPVAFGLLGGFIATIPQ